MGIQPFKYLLTIFIIILSSFPVTKTTAQDYPVRVNLFLVPPYSQNLTDYYAPGSNLMFANVLLTDATQSDLEVVFRVSITGDRLKLTSKPNLAITPITIQGGQLYRLTGEELAPYFLPQNLTVEGSGASAFLNGSKLPEGYYIFSVEVVEYYRKVVVSNQGLAFAWVMFNDPPQWVTPQNYSILTASQPQNILFTWMAMNTSSPNSAMTTNYEFKICEMPDQNSDPNVVLGTTNPIYTEEVSRTSLIYGPDKPTLEVGKFYACQLRAFDTEGRDRFNNNGLSLPLVFKFGEACNSPLSVNHSDVHKNKATLKWTANQNNAAYNVQLRQNNDSSLTDWYDYPSDRTSLTIKQLQSGTRYEYQVKAICGDKYTGLSSAYSPVQSFTTEKSGNTNYNCNDMVDKPEITSTIPVPRLRVGQTIDAAGFWSTITQITSDVNGIYSGYSETLLMVWTLKVYCKFTNITVNADGQLLSGTIEALRTEDVNWVGGQGPDSGGNSGNTGDSVPDTFTQDSLIVEDTPIDSVVVTSNGTTVIYESDGTVTTIGLTDNLQIEDPGNNVYVVEDGKVYKNPDNVDPSNGGPGNTNYDKLITVRFVKQNDMPFYGFDSHDPKLTAFDANYQTTTVHRNSYYIPWVAVQSFGGDVVAANINLAGNSPKYNDVHFRGPAGPVTTTPGTSDSTFYIAVQGSSAGSEQAYEAFYTDSTTNGSEKEIIAGQLNVAAYDPTSVDVCIVTVNSTVYPYDIGILQKELNTIFRQAVATVSVSTLHLTGVEWDIDPQNNKLSDAETGLLSSYNKEMKRLRRALKNNNSYNDDTYYLFILPASDKDDLTGYMPLKGQFGFIFTKTNGSQEKMTQSIAHELSHGVFHLWHTFSIENKYIAAQGTTHNLMDYTNDPDDLGLIKFQWDFIHNPESMIGWLQEDEEGESSLPCVGWFDECDDVLKILSNIRAKRINGENLTIKGQQNSEETCIKAIAINIGEIDYAKIRLIYKPTTNDITFNPMDYELYDKQFLLADGSTDWQSGFVYYKDNEELFKIIVDDESSKISKLNEYLFNKNEEIINSGDRYIVFKSNANIRSKTKPYNLLSPKVYLEKGKEVELVSHLAKGESPRALVKYVGETEEYCTWTGNLKKVVSIEDDQQYKLRNDLSPVVLPYSEITNSKVTTEVILYITHECGEYKCINKKEGEEFEKLGWVKSESLRKYIDLSKLSKEEFNQKYAQAAETAVNAIIADWRTNESACNLCVRAALYNLTGDEVLYPIMGSSTTIRDKGEQLYGKVITGGGSAQDIIDDLKSGNLDEYFEEIVKTETEYSDYWERIQNMVDNNKEIIIGTYDPGHVFMVVPGGLYSVIDNTSREKSGLNISDTKVELGDRWGGSFARENINLVLRIMDCGLGVKYANGPVYGVMDAKPLIGKKESKIVKFYKYIKP